jgi:hypothetical protein
LAARFLDHSTAGLVLGCGLVFLAFDLANKQSFENQWLLASQLVVAALACRAIQPSLSLPADMLDQKLSGGGRSATREGAAP